METEFQQPHVHTPVRRGDCVACHNGHGSNESTLLKAVDSDLCWQCHEELMQEEPGALVHDPFEGGECLTCHVPHASPHAGVLAGAQDEICGECHDDVQEDLSAAMSKHKPVGR
jgi:predicted CXXCH cytochrome family protein